MTQHPLTPETASVRASARHRSHVRRAGKPSWGGLFLRALPIALLLGGCATEAADHAVNPVTIRSLPPVTAVAEVADLEARRALSAALQATTREHDFVTTVRVDESAVATIGSAVPQPYVPWYLNDQGAGAPTPLEGLMDPVVVTIDQDGDGHTVYEALYHGDDVGVPDVAEVEVRVTIEDGKVLQVKHQMPLDGETVEVVTVVSNRLDE